MSKEVVAKNIFRLRKIVGLNQKEAAARSGISRPAFASIEKGEADPRTDTLHKIASALHVSIQDLFLDMPELRSVRFRMSRITDQKRKLREQEIITIALWLKNYNCLEEVLQRPMSYQLAQVKNRDARKAAQKVREVLELGPDEPVADIVEVINKAGIKLYRSDVQIDRFFGLSIGPEDGGPAISVNVASTISIERQIFTAAHEMGHLVLHKSSFNGELLEEDDSEELEANQFASYFLMPQKAFGRELERNRGLHWVDMVLTVKRYFKVSYKTVLMRLIDMGLADSSLYRDFAVEHKHMYGGSLKDHFEPAALREPEGMTRGIIMDDRLYTLVREAVEKGLITLGRAAEILGKTGQEMRELAGSWRKLTGAD